METPPRLVFRGGVRRCDKNSVDKNSTVRDNNSMRDVIARHDQNMRDARSESDSAANAKYKELSAQGKDYNKEIRPATDAIRNDGRARIAGHERELRAYLSDKGFKSSGEKRDFGGNTTEQFTHPEGVVTLRTTQDGIKSASFQSRGEIDAKARTDANWARVDRDRNRPGGGF